ncbi:hypothetical protein [Hyphomicrobium methylovorum]|uniref:hypothetical protein n=1 Tax=Hyphomicrobium methylovorum TaxID=84 RepID=UPI0031B5C327
MRTITAFGGNLRGILKALILVMALSAPVFPAAAKEDWNKVANIQDAAKRLAVLHKREGSAGVMKFLDACYRTHMLSSTFTQGLEACLAQDYMHTQVLARIYARIPQKERVKMGVPAPEELANGMGQRFVAAFSQYKIGVKKAEAFRQLVDKNGMPIFVRAVFPAEAEKNKLGDEGAQGEK